MILFYPLCTPESAVQITRERNGNSNQFWLHGGNMFLQTSNQYFIYMCIVCLQCRIEFVKTICRAAKFFCISAEAKMHIYTFCNKIRNIFKVHGSKMFGQILFAHTAKGPAKIICLHKAGGFR